MSAINQPVAVARGGVDVVDPRAFGAIGDGVSHPIRSGDVARLGQSYEVGDEWDFVGIQEAIRAAFYTDGEPHGFAAWRNRQLHIAAGRYLVNKPPTVELLQSGVIYGDGRQATVIQSIADCAALQFNGAWYSELRGIGFAALAARAGALVELDGNFDAVHTQGVQGCTVRECGFNGATLAAYGAAITRRGTANGQGSENLFVNCSWQSSLTAGLYVVGFNALQNTVLGGNFQGHPTCGIRLVGGSVNVYGTGFQSASGYSQIANDGWDIDCSVAGAHDRIIVDGCRSESLRFYRGAWSQYAVLRACSQRNISTLVWTAAGDYVADAVVSGASAGGDVHLYRCTTPGTSGEAEPTWPVSGTVADGSVVWTELTYNAVEIAAGSVSDCAFGPGARIATPARSETFVERNSFMRSDYKAVGSGGVFTNNFRIPFEALA